MKHAITLNNSEATAFLEDHFKQAFGLGEVSVKIEDSSTPQINWQDVVTIMLETKRAYNHGREKIAAIKFVRSKLMGMGLTEAKKFVEDVFE